MWKPLQKDWSLQFPTRFVVLTQFYQEAPTFFFNNFEASYHKGYSGGRLLSEQTDWNRLQSSLKIDFNKALEKWYRTGWK